jgi:hypothetical protein
MIYSILSGDIVKSTRLSQAALDGAMTLIHKTLQGRHHDSIHFTRYRGDGWQAASARPFDALENAIAVLANLRVDGFCSRIAIGIGTVDNLGTTDLSDARGAAFTASGHALDRMQRGQTLAIAGDGIGNEDKAIVALLDERISRWTREQAEAVAKSLSPQKTTDKESAKSLGITPQAMSDRLHGAGFPSIWYALTLWRDAKIAQGWADTTYD